MQVADKRKLANSDTETQHRLNKYKKKCIPKHISKVVDSRSQESVKLSMPESIEKFHKNISIGPEYICTCCEQLWYKSSVTKCNPDLYKSCSHETLNLCISSLRSIDDTEWICTTCHFNLKCGKVPSCARANQMTFSAKPDVLKNLTPLEERLILPRIPFMQVRELPSGGQLSIHGNVVNVPADVNSTVSVLPRQSMSHRRK